MGVREFVMKPFSVREMAETIRIVLEKKGQAGFERYLPFPKSALTFSRSMDPSWVLGKAGTKSTYLGFL